SISTLADTYTLTITDISSSLTHTVMVALVMIAPDYTLSASPSSQTVTQNGATSYNVIITATGKFVGQITLKMSGLPSGANNSFNPNPATTSTTLSMTTNTSTPAGTYTLTISKVNSSLTHNTTITLI